MEGLSLENSKEAPSGAMEGVNVQGDNGEAPSGALESILGVVGLGDQPGDGFGNGGFNSAGTEIVLMEVGNEVSKGASKYLVCQTDTKGVVGGKLAGQGPFFMFIPDEVVKSERPLQLGDIIMVSEWEVRAGYERLSSDLASKDPRPWYFQGRINWQATANVVSDVQLGRGTFQPAIVGEVKRYAGGGFKCATLMAALMLRSQVVYNRQLTEIQPHEVVINQVVYVCLPQ